MTILYIFCFLLIQAFIAVHLLIQVQKEFLILYEKMESYQNFINESKEDA